MYLNGRQKTEDIQRFLSTQERKVSRDPFYSTGHTPKKDVPQKGKSHTFGQVENLN
jgi:hypothetical protein